MTNPPHTTRRVGQEGMTLVELMIAMLLTGVIVTMMMGAYMVAQRSDRQNAEDAQALANLRLVTDRIGADLREARRVYADSSGTRLHFWADTDRDNQQDLGERITFELLTLSGSAPTTAGVAAKLVRRTDVTGSETLVSEGMKAFAGRNVFLYSPTFTPVAAPSAVWTETTLVSLVMAADEADKPYPGPRTLKTDLRLRNARTY